MHLLRRQPLHDAMYVETMRAFTPHQGAVVPGHFAIWAASVEGHSANAATVVVGDPSPGSDGGVIFNRNFHVMAMIFRQARLRREHDVFNFFLFVFQTLFAGERNRKLTF